MTPMDNPIFSGAAVLFTVLMMLSLRSALQVLPHLMRCLGRWKANVEIEDSLQLSRSRNWIAFLLFVPLCMVAFHHKMYTPDFLLALPPLWQFPAVVGVMTAYVLLRTFLNWQLEQGARGSRTFQAANRSFFNYMILLFVLLGGLGLVLSLTRLPQAAVTRILWLAALAFYLLSVVRRGQIFSSVCNPFITFLYLCGLEFFPTAALVVSAVLL